MKYVLTNNHRNVSNNDLLDDIKEVAKKLQKCTLTVAEYNKNGKYSPNTFYRRFGSWAKVLEQAGLDIDFKNIKISREEYISDLKKVAKALKRKTITQTEYRKYGRHDKDRVSKHFNGWENALIAAGLEPTGNRHSISDEELLREIEDLWISLGRQPTTTDILKCSTKYSINTYLRHFGSWHNAMIAFVHWANDCQESGESLNETSSCQESLKKEMKSVCHLTPREVNLRLRFQVMQRDNFKCRICGASPATNPSITLHIDHIVPWSKGGETTLDNLQTLCSDCNLGKSNLELK